MIRWAKRQRERVERAISAHPVRSGRCAELAQTILPIAIDLDPASHAIVVRPARRAMRYVAAKEPAGARWFHHVTVHADEHRVDAMTGPDGHRASTYLQDFFEYPDDLVERVVHDDEWSTL